MDMGQYHEDCRVWRTQDNKFWTYFQSHSIKAQAFLRDRQQKLRQGGYGANKLVRIEEAFENISQETGEDRLEVTNLAGANMSLTTQVVEYANHLVTKDSNMETTKKTISQMQGEIKTFKSKLEGQSTKRPVTTHNQEKYYNWCSTTYL